MSAASSARPAACASTSRQPDGVAIPGVNAAGDALFTSVDTNAGEPGRAKSYSGTAWRIAVSDDHSHVLTLFSAAKGGEGAKERISLRTASGETAAVDHDGTQGGVIVQFGLIGEATLSVQQNVGGIGSSPCEANAVAMFLD